MKIKDFMCNDKIVKDFVSKMKNDEIFSTAEASEKTGLNQRLIMYYFLKHEIPHFRVGCNIFWGTEKAIKSLKERN